MGYKVFAAPLCACFYRSVKIYAAPLGYAHPQLPLLRRAQQTVASLGLAAVCLALLRVFKENSFKKADKKPLWHVHGNAWLANVSVSSSALAMASPFYDYSLWS